MLSKFNVLIIGAGNIGALYDFPGSRNILSHAHAFSKHSGFKLLGFVDTDFAKAQKAALVWGVKPYRTIEEAFSSTAIDIACVSVPDEFHYDVLMKLSGYPVRLVFAEKPLAKKMKEAKRIKQVYHKKKIPVCVNYIRRFIPEFDDLKDTIHSKKYGRFVTGTGFYGKGLLHNGSHLIDLLRFFIGDFKSVAILKRNSDFYSDDQSVSAVLSINDNRFFYLNAIDCNLFTIFEMDFIFEKGRVRIKDLGQKIEISQVQDSEVFKGYRNLIRKKEVSTSFYNYLFFAAENIYQHLVKNAPLKCTLDDGYMAMQLCNDIINSDKV